MLLHVNFLKYSHTFIYYKFSSFAVSLHQFQHTVAGRSFSLFTTIHKFPYDFTKLFSLVQIRFCHSFTMSNNDDIPSNTIKVKCWFQVASTFSALPNILTKQLQLNPNRSTEEPRGCKSCERYQPRQTQTHALTPIDGVEIGMRAIGARTQTILLSGDGEERKTTQLLLGCGAPRVGKQSMWHSIDHSAAKDGIERCLV